MLYEGLCARVYHRLLGIGNKEGDEGENGECVRKEGNKAFDDGGGIIFTQDSKSKGSWMVFNLQFGHLI